MKLSHCKKGMFVFRPSEPDLVGIVEDFVTRGQTMKWWVAVRWPSSSALTGETTFERALNLEPYVD
jgi:hypothetical protein